MQMRSAIVTLLAIVSALAVGRGAMAAPGDASAGWPEFRGPWGNGHASAGPLGLPLTWSETENVRWKTPIPLQGWSTPVVLDGQVWLTTATEDGHDFHVVCVDADTGAIRFNERIFHSDNPEPLGNNVNGYASPSPAIEPGRVYVHFGSYGTACLDTRTFQVLWERTDLPCRHYRGPGSSIILFENLLVLTFDGVDQQYLAALDKETGKTVWRADRTTAWNDLDEQGRPKREGDFRKAFSTPLIVDAGGTTQLISAGSSALFSYDPRTGKELWTVRMNGYTPAMRPVFGHGLAFVGTGRGQAELLAVRVDGRGDVTDTHVAWKAEGSVVPLEPSPVLVDDLLYTVSNNGAVTSFEATTGNRLWSERLGGNYLASPVYADGRLYVFNTQGKATVLKPGRTFEVLATNELADGCLASPAVAGKALYVRTRTHLYRIEDATPK